MTLALLGALCAAGCDDDDNTSADASVTPGDGAAASDAPSGEGSATTLYERLGQHAGIRSAVEAIVTDETADPEIASFFVLLGKPGHPTADQLQECLTVQLSEAAGGTEKYATPLGAAHGNYTCRDMKSTHAAFHISSVTFDKFATIAVATLTRLKVAPADIGTIGSVLGSTKGDIVDPASTTTSFAVDGGASDGGAGDGGSTDAGVTDAGDAATTLYQRLGQHAGIRSAVDAIVGKELMDPEIASFFVFQAGPTAGHPSAAQIEECLTYQLGQAAGGPEVYPVTLPADAGSYVCRDMATIHAPFHISGPTFDKFVMIAATTLTGLGVAPADVNAVGGVLNSTKAAIVTSTSDAGAFFDAGTQ